MLFKYVNFSFQISQCTHAYTYLINSTSIAFPRNEVSDETDTGPIASVNFCSFSSFSPNTDMMEKENLRRDGVLLPTAVLMLPLFEPHNLSLVVFH